jgi:hypothetical protein
MRVSKEQLRYLKEGQFGIETPPNGPFVVSPADHQGIHVGDLLVSMAAELSIIRERSEERELAKKQPLPRDPFD